ncbi:MAG: right-handed parallel beta-helix repeat-containing protein [Flavobacteriales bacterium]|nr:right-handed parallel beta-helix repeat-containing protein [Flavobacteriales bacterium]
MEALVVGRKYDHIEIEFRSYRNRMIHSMVGSGSAAVGLTLAAWKEDEYRTMNTKNTSPRPMRHLLCISALLACASTYPQTYYVDANVATSGDGSIGAPFKTIADLNNAVVNHEIQSNTTVYLRRGGEYPGTITTASSASNVHIGPDPQSSGTDPVLFGSEVVEVGADVVFDDPLDPDDGDWEDQGGGVWKIVLDPGVIPKYLFNGGSVCTLARSPNAGTWMRNQVYHTDAAQTTLYATTAFPNAAAGSQIVIRESNFRFSVREVVGIVPEAVNPGWYTAIPTDNTVVDKIQLDAPLVSSQVTYYDWGFFLQNKLEWLDQEGEWWFNPGSGELYLKTNGSAPTDVRASIYLEGIHVQSGASQVVIEDLDLRHYYERGVRVRGGCTGVQLLGCDITDMANGYYDSSGPGQSYGHTVSGCRFERIFNVGLYSMGGYGPNSQPTLITGNTFQQIGTIAGLGGDFGYQGSVCAGLGYLAEHNTYETIGYAPVGLFGTGTFRENSLTKGLTVLNDGGGVQIDRCDGVKIQDNIITNMGDPSNLLQGAATNFYAAEPITYGIYFGDHYIVNTTVEGNTVSGCDKGIHVDHSLCSENAVIRNNTLFGNRVQLSITDFSNYRNTDMIDEEYVPLPAECSGNGNGTSDQGIGGVNYRSTYTDIYTDNILYCLGGDQRCLEFGQVYASAFAGTEGLVRFGTFDRNYYFDPFSDVPVHIGTFYGKRVTIPQTLPVWRQSTEQDQGSFTSPLHLKDYSATLLNLTDIVSDGDFTGLNVGLWDWPVCLPNQPACGSRSIVTMNGEPALRSVNCRNVEEACAYTAFTSNDPEDYLLRFTLRTAGHGTLRGTICYDNTPVTQNYVGGRSFGTGPEPRTYEIPIHLEDAPDDYTYAIFLDEEFESGARTTSDVTVDNVEVYSCTMDPDHYANEIAPNHILRYNNPLEQTMNDPQNVAATGGEVTLGPGCWSDVYGTIYSGTVPLDPWESIVLFKLSGAFDHSNGYTVNGDEVWSTDKNIRGSLVVPNGASLTIDGATIGFADSRVDNNPTTNVVVQPGGVLRLVNGALLTSVPGAACDGGMWDGVKVLGNETSVGAGLVEMNSGARIENAYVALLGSNGDPVTLNTSSGAGGRMLLDDAGFVNNVRDVVRYGEQQPVDMVVNNCRFITTRELVDPTLVPLSHVWLLSTGTTSFHGCTFGNLRDDLPSDPEERGVCGIVGLAANVNVEPLAPGEPGNRFVNLYSGVKHYSVNQTTLVVDQNLFEGCSRGVAVVGTPNVTFTRNEVHVRGTEGSSPANYGTYFYNSRSFEYEQNSFLGMDDGALKAGSVFHTIGPYNDEVYKNTYDRFNGSIGTLYSAGLIFSGVNSSADQSAGISWRCNDLSLLHENDHDVGFTDGAGATTVRNTQGTDLNQQTLAGNRYTDLNIVCTNAPDKHLYVEDGNINLFYYNHHEQVVADQYDLRPECSSPPIDPQMQFSVSPGVYYTDDPVMGSCVPNLAIPTPSVDIEDEIVWAE